MKSKTFEGGSEGWSEGGRDVSDWLHETLGWRFLGCWWRCRTLPGFETLSFMAYSKDENFSREFVLGNGDTIMFDEKTGEVTIHESED